MRKTFALLILIGAAALGACSNTERKINDDRAYSDPEAQKTKAFFDGVTDVLYGRD